MDIKFQSEWKRVSSFMESLIRSRYTTYSEMLSVFKNLVPVPSALSASDKYKLHIDTLKKEVQDMSLGVIVASNRESAKGLPRGALKLRPCSAESNRSEHRWERSGRACAP